VHYEDVVRRLTGVLRSSSDPGIELILARARESAVSEATAIIERLITRSILERAADHLAASHPDDATASSERARGRAPPWAWYVYGIQPAAADLPAGVAGVVGSEVDGVEAAGLRAIVSQVRDDEFGGEAQRDKLDDLEWVGANARAHEAVLVAALGAGPVLPLRFGTAFHSRQAVVDVLRRHADELHAEAERMTGRSEWGTKALIELDACDRWIAQHLPGIGEAAGQPPPTGGRTYLARKQAERGVRDERRRVLLDLATEIHERLSDFAVDACTDRPQQPELSGHEGEMILNGAYLLDDASIEPFHEAARELAERHADKGLTVKTTGPWPPHHFISLPPIDDVGETA
jgi:Gas vesicle synthesis protein GvpL/GvpF